MQASVGVALAALVHAAGAAGAALAECATPPNEPAPFDRPPRGPGVGDSRGGGSPRAVEVASSAQAYTYLVDRRPSRIHGMGYNPHGLEQSASERVARLKRDFALMRTSGVDTLFGWDPAAFDRLTFDAVDEAGLGAERGRRAAAFAELCASIRAYPDYVLGGAVYVWYADGPEAVDGELGLVDHAGQPVDDALGRLYREDASSESAA